MIYNIQTVKRILLIFLSVFSLGLSAQKYFGDYMIVGSSLTYIPQVTKDTYGTYWGYTEYTWNINWGIRFSKRFFTGLQLLNIYSSEVYTKKQSYHIYGLFTQFDFLPDKKSRFFAEFSVNRGDYSVSSGMPTRKRNLYYLGTGLGYDLPIKWVPNLYLDLSFLIYARPDDISSQNWYTQYVVGLNYKID